jgi:hypothetical protein
MGWECAAKRSDDFAMVLALLITGSGNRHRHDLLIVSGSGLSLYHALAYTKRGQLNEAKLRPWQRADLQKRRLLHRDELDLTRNFIDLWRRQTVT